MVDTQKEPGVRINQIFLNRALFEHSSDPMTGPLPSDAGNHKISVMASAAQSADRNTGIMTVVVQTAPDNTGHYRFIVEMMLVVSIEPGQENMTIDEYLTGPAGPTLFPFLREAVAALTGRGRFGPVWLRPINFARLGEMAPADGATE